MAYVKNYNPGTITMDLPKANYFYELPLLSIGDIHGPFHLSLVFNRSMAKAGLNPFAMAAGYKLNVHKMLNVEDPNEPYLLDANGKRVAFHEENGVYVFDDDSQRIMRYVNDIYTSYIIENPDYSVEYYNRYGYITSVVDKYGTEVLRYQYDNKMHLTHIIFRGDKVIQFDYPSGTMAAMKYQGTTYYTALSFSTTATTIYHYSGVKYVLNYGNNTGFRAYSAESYSSNDPCREIRLNGTSGDRITVTEYEGDSLVNTTIYVFYGDVSDPDTNYSQVEITNHEGVQTRVQYQFGKPLYSYELTNGEAAFDSEKYLGNVQIYNTVDDWKNTQAIGPQTINDGIAMSCNNNEQRFEYDASTHYLQGQKGIFVLSGWFKKQASNVTVEEEKLYVADGVGDNIAEFSLGNLIDSQWRFFAYKVYMDTNFIQVWPENSDRVELKDLRITFWPTHVWMTEERSHVAISEDVLLYWTETGYKHIPLHSARFACGDSLIPDYQKITFRDILQYKLNQINNQNTAEVYCGNLSAVYTLGASETFTVMHGDVTKEVNQCYLGKRSYSADGVVTVRVRDDYANDYLVYETLDKNGNIISYQALNSYLDVIRTNSQGVTTTYVRNGGLIVSESVKRDSNNTTLYTRTNTYDAANSRITATDEFGNRTVYTLDPVWGVVKSVTFPDGTVITDTYDDDMCALTKRIYGKTGSTTNRSLSLAYSNGNISAMSTGSLNYAFTYLGDKLTKITKNAAIIEMHSHTDPAEDNDYCTTIVSRYPSAANPMHSVTASFDKYGRLITIDGVVTNTYDLWPSFNATTGALIPSVDNGSAHLAMTVDDIAGQTIRYDYNTRGLLEERTVTDKSNFATKISSENFTYDEQGRLATHTATYDTTNNQSVGEAIYYTDKTDSAAANSAVKTYDYKVNGVSKSITENTFDEYNRLEEKTVKFAAKTLTRTIGYTATRATCVCDVIAGANVGMNTYSYDALGRIVTDSYSSDKSDSDLKSYSYDQYGQLIRENNLGLAKTFVYAYNDIGNLTSVKAYAYTLNPTLSGSCTTTTFGYSNDKLSSFDGSSIAYNAMGCPTSYEGMSATWRKGKLSQLSSGTATTGISQYAYTYNGFGQRVSRNYAYQASTSGLNLPETGQVIACNRTYYYDYSGRLIAETINKTHYNASATTEKIVYLYDESSIVGIDYTSNGATYRYFFQKNLQGDVTAIFNTSGVLKAKYLYDAWGNCTVSSETTDYDLANANPIRYRGYYYDDDTGLYYCNARYYSPKWRRFISPDDTAYLDPDSVNGLNLYCYCNNNPIGIKHTIPARYMASVIADQGYPLRVNTQKVQNSVHWKGTWFDTSLPSFLVFSTGKASLVDWGLSVYKGSLYFDEAENHSLYISLGNVSVFAGLNVEKHKYGVFADANVLSAGYDGRYIDAGVSIVGVGFILGFENKKFRIKVDPPGFFGFEIAIDFGQIIKDLFGWEW